MNETKRKPLYQPWNEETFRADLHVGAMTPTQRWIYRTLLQAAFFHSTRPYLPDDDVQLWLLAGCESPKQWERNKDAVRAKFTPVEVDGVRLLSQKRLLADWERIEEKRQSLAVAGRKGGLVKAKPAPSICLPDANQAQANANQEKLREGKEEKEKRIKPTSAPEAGALVILPDWIPLEAWNDFLEMRRSLRRPLTRKAVALMLRKLVKLREEGQSIQAVLEQSTLNSWQDVFPIRQEHGNGRTNTNEPKSFDAARNEATDAALRRVLDRARASTAQTRPQLPARIGRNGNLDLHGATEGFAAGQN